MISNLSVIFSRMIGTLAVMLVVSAFLGTSDRLAKYIHLESGWKGNLVAALIGGLFGIYGNISGFVLNEAVVSVRDIGPMLAGYLGGPIGGLGAGIIAAAQRLTMGGITANACAIATTCIGLMTGFISYKFHDKFEKPLFTLLLSAGMETFHLCVVLLMVKPFETALSIVRSMVIPFIGVNAVGYMMMITIIQYTRNQQVLSAEKNRMESELEVASVIQHSLLPLLNEDYPGWKGLEISASMDAAKEVGGDFYDVFFVDPTHLAIEIGDVSGKSVPAAMFMASSKITLQNCIRDIPNLEAAIAAANNALCARNEAQMFLTLWVGILDLVTGEITFINAGHNPPILMHNGEAQYMRLRSGFVLGGMEDMKYSAHHQQLDSGDTLYLYTDGVTEAEDSYHNLFGEERLLFCFAGKTDRSPSSIILTIQGSVEAFVNGNDQFDDMTMLCVRWNKQAEAKN